MKTLSSLLALLALASSVFAQSSFRASSSNATYIAYRTDGRAGTGTATDPYNGSTDSRLENLLSNAPAGQTIMFLPSLRYTTRVKLSSGYPPWRPKLNQTYYAIGGKDAVKWSVSTNQNPDYMTNGGVNALFHAEGQPERITVDGFWFDMNIDYFNRYATNGSTRVINAGNVMEVYTDGSLIQNCRVQGHWGGFTGTNQNGSECFPIAFGGIVPTITNNWVATRYYAGNTIRNNEIIHTNAWNSPWTYGGMIGAGGITGMGEGAEAAYKSNRWAFGWWINEGNTYIATTNASVGGFIAATRSIYRNNTLRNARLSYQDYWMQGDILFEGNSVVSSSYGPSGRDSIAVDYVLSTNKNWDIHTDSSAPRYERAFDIVYRNNHFEQTLGSSQSGSGANSLFRIYNANGFFNPSTGGYIGGTNFIIEGNTFIGPTNRSVMGIFGSLRNSVIQNNTFRNLQYAFWDTNPVKEDIVFEGNTVENCGIGYWALGSGTNWIGTNSHNRITIRNNTFKNMNSEAFIGTADNLTIDGNRVFGYTIVDPNYQAAFNITTNDIWTGAGATYSRKATNITIRDNLTLTPPGTNRSFWLSVDGAHGLTITGNKHDSLYGENISATTATSIGEVVHNALYITNFNGLAGVYTNGVLLTPAGGGSENTQPGTNLVMAGTTLSLSNSIINDSFKSRSNSTYLGGALLAGQWASWASNGVWHLTAPHGSVLTLNSNGVILTNGVALATGGGAGSDAVLSNAFIAGSNLFTAQIAASSNYFAVAAIAATNGTGTNTTLRGNVVLSLTNSTATDGFVAYAFDGKVKWSNAPAGGGGGGNVSATNNGASGEMAIYGGSDKMIAFTNTLSEVVIDLDGVQTNTLLITGSDTYVRGAAPNTNQFVWSTNGFGIKSGATVTNLNAIGTNLTSALMVYGPPTNGAAAGTNTIASFFRGTNNVVNVRSNGVLEALYGIAGTNGGAAVNIDSSGNIGLIGARRVSSTTDLYLGNDTGQLYLDDNPRINFGGDWGGNWVRPLTTNRVGFGITNMVVTNLATTNFVSLPAFTWTHTNNSFTNILVSTLVGPWVKVTNAAPIVNTPYTNTARRAVVRANAILNSGAAAGTGALALVVSGQTNDIAQKAALAVGEQIEIMAATLDPFEVYWFTNNSSGTGTASLTNVIVSGY